MFELAMGALLTYWIVWAVANAAADIIAVSTGRTNPRVERAKVRAKKRGDNPYWQSIRTELTGWLSDVVTDAHTEANRRREEKRQRQAEARRKRDLEEHPTVDAEFTIIDDEPTEGTCENGAPVNSRNCGWPQCPDHGHLNRPQQDDSTADTNSNGTTDTEGDTIMSGYEGGLDGFLAYLDGCAENLRTYQSEQVLSQMVNSEMGSESVAMVQHAQQKAAEAAAAFDDASGFISTANKGAQEQTSTETGNKDFLLNR
jgi:hypothetical protein